MFLDTSGLLCFFDEKDSRHTAAVRLVKSSNLFVTSNYVLAEFAPLCQTRKLNRENTLEFIRVLKKNPLIEVVWIDENLHQRGFELSEQRLDKSYSLCDAVSFVIMREREIAEALTTDKHFEQEGFIKLLES